MKKIIFIMSLLCAGFGFSSCEDDVDTSEGIVSTTPARDLAGSYHGVFSVTKNTKNPTTVEIEGDVIIAENPESGMYVANVSVALSDGSYTGSSLLNVVRTERGSYLQNGVAKFNNKSANGVSGFIDVDNSLTLKFRAQSGFSTTDYVFSGKINN